MEDKNIMGGLKVGLKRCGEGASVPEPAYFYAYISSTTTAEEELNKINAIEIP